MEAKHWVVMVSEMRRFPQMSYKSDITVISGLDEGDMKAVDQCFKGIDAPCQLDKEDGRFVLKGPAFNPMSVINTLTEQRSYTVEFNPQQHNIPLKQGNLDDKFAIIYHLSKTVKKSGSSTAGSNSNDPLPPPRTDSLPQTAQTDPVRRQFS